MLVDRDISEELANWRADYSCTHCRSYVTDVSYLDIYNLRPYGEIARACSKCPQCGTVNTVYMQKKEYYVLSTAKMHKKRTVSLQNVSNLLTSSNGYKILRSVLYSIALYSLGYTVIKPSNYLTMLGIFTTLFILFTDTNWSVADKDSHYLSKMFLKDYYAMLVILYFCAVVALFVIFLRSL